MRLRALARALALATAACCTCDRSIAQQTSCSEHRRQSDL